MCIIVSLKKCRLWVTFKSSQRKPCQSCSWGPIVTWKVEEYSSQYLRSPFTYACWGSRDTGWRVILDAFLRIGPSLLCVSHNFVWGGRAGTIWAWPILIPRWSGAQLEGIVLKKSLCFFMELGGTHAKRGSGSQSPPSQVIPMTLFTSHAPRAK